MSDPELVDLAGSVWLRRHAIADGYTDRKIAQLVRSGEWHRVRHGAYCAGALWESLGPADRHRVLSRAVLLTAHNATVLSHISAAIERGAPVWGVALDRVHTTRTDGRSGRKAADVAQHRGVLPESQVEQVNAVPVTSAPRCAVEMCVLTTVESALVTVNGLLNMKLTSLEDVTALAHDTRFWPEGITTRLVLGLADRRVESPAESRFSYLCWLHHLPKPTPQVEIFDEEGRLVARLDFALAEYGVFIEVDGKEKYRKHRRPGESLEDFLMREKRREELVCMLTGWICIRVTWADLQQPEKLARRIRSVLGSRARPGA